MQTNPKYLVYIDSYIDALTMYVSVKTQTLFWKINSSCKLILKLKNSIGIVVNIPEYK